MKIECLLTFFQCNGFSAGVNPDDFRGPGFDSGYDPVWVRKVLAMIAQLIDPHL